MTDPATRERQAREELRAVQVARLVTREREARDHLALTVYWAEVRRSTLWDLKEELGTWKKVAAATGQTVPAITKAAYKKAKET
jgi:hypothetical protein